MKRVKHYRYRLHPHPFTCNNHAPMWPVVICQQHVPQIMWDLGEWSGFILRLGKANGEGFEGKYMTTTRILIRMPSSGGCFYCPVSVCFVGGVLYMWAPRRNCTCYHHMSPWHDMIWTVFVPATCASITCGSNNVDRTAALFCQQESWFRVGHQSSPRKFTKNLWTVSWRTTRWKLRVVRLGWEREQSWAVLGEIPLWKVADKLIAMLHLLLRLQAKFPYVCCFETLEQ